MGKDINRGLCILQEAQNHYERLEEFRRQRDRNKRYTYGDQWSDIVEVDGRRITEEQYIKEQGSIPLKNNLIRRLVRNVIGIYQTQSNQPYCIARDKAERALSDTMNVLLSYNADINRMTALNTRSIEEFLISGMVIHKKNYGRRNGRNDCWTDYIQPNNFFVDNMMRDFRGWDCRCVGEIHHVTMEDVISQFADSAERASWLTSIYGSTDDNSMCKVIEVWRRENTQHYRCHDPKSGKAYNAPISRVKAIEQENNRRKKRSQPQIKYQWVNEECWRYYFLSPTGHILREGDTPYAHGSHPYVFRIYPMIDGEVHSFVSDVVDQQRYTNRLITLYDWIMRASAKGVLLVPEDCIPRGCSPDDFADAWSRYNGVIFYKPSVQGAVPQQVANNSTNIGIRELLDVQLKFFEDISGVNTALQGKTGNHAISAELYGQQTLNATTTLIDVIGAFNEFVRDGAYKDLKNIQQYYTPEYIRKIAGDNCEIERLQDIELDLSMRSTLTTMAERQSNNALLLEIWKTGQISLQQMLKAGDFNFADAL